MNGSPRNRAVAKRDRRAKPRRMRHIGNSMLTEWRAACLAAVPQRPDSSQRRIDVAGTVGITYQCFTIDCSRMRSVNRFTAPPPLLSCSHVNNRLPAIHPLTNWKRRHRLLFHFGELPFQHGSDEAAGRVSLLFQVIELSFKVEGQLNDDSYKFWHTLAPLIDTPVQARTSECTCYALLSRDET